MHVFGRGINGGGVSAMVANGGGGGGVRWAVVVVVVGLYRQPLGVHLLSWMAP